MIRCCKLPDYIRLPSGELLEPVIGGHLRNKPFLTVEHSGVDVRKNGWGGGLFESQVHELIVAEARRRNLRYRRVAVLSRGLRGKRDLHGQPYRANVWIFVQVEPAVIDAPAATATV